eukprot:CAMPEP_0203787414 /NCGR_PEP_ID=MMETSP0100_2-20121128/2219_1 /ASSEMBLY_ACC=CAM_ASM_000210 /TAXON_ID=96639 /ORGANISM=" , Strain NY0313808BC1" /LENGTH=476 /DNA_ID=CAMNT_0050689925 /DNA_START=1056 /DNA_END=2486 /DNA_ORIENTATION=+
MDASTVSFVIKMEGTPADKPRPSSSLYPPLRRWIWSYPIEQDLPYDIAAGVTVGLMAIPQSLSYALIAGMPPQYGLYSDLQICYPIFGTSRFLVVGPVAVMSLMSRIAMEKLSIEESSVEWVDMVCFLSVTVAVIQFAIGLLGLGNRISSLLPESAIVGFSSAAALIIGGTQLTSLFGLSKCKLESGHSCGFLSTIVYVVSHISEAKIASLSIGLGSFALLYGFRNAPRLRTEGLLTNLIPKLGALSVVVTSIIVVYLHGETEFLKDAQLVGQIPKGLPSPRWIPVLPSDPFVLCSLFFSSIPIALVGFAEATAIAKASTKLRGQDPSLIDDNEEVLALAFCNAFTAWVGGYPVTGSFSRTAINAESGARSALSTAVAALAVVAVLLFCTEALALLPKAAVSSIVLFAVVRLIDYKEFQKYLSEYRENPQENLDIVVSTSVFASSLLLGVEVGLFLGVVANSLTNLYKKKQLSVKY